MTGKNKTRLVGWHPSDPAAVDWLDTEIGRRGGGRGAQSAILDEALEQAMTETARLTGADHRMIAKAREVAALQSGGAMRERYGDADSGMAQAAALGEAQFLLLELAAIIARLDGHG